MPREGGTSRRAADRERTSLCAGVLELAEYTGGPGISVVAITDSMVAPIARIAEHVILVPTDSLFLPRHVARLLSSRFSARSSPGGAATMRSQRCIAPTNTSRHSTPTSSPPGER